MGLLNLGARPHCTQLICLLVLRPPISLLLAQQLTRWLMWAGVTAAGVGVRAHAAPRILVRSHARSIVHDGRRCSLFKQYFCLFFQNFIRVDGVFWSYPPKCFLNV